MSPQEAGDGLESIVEFHVQIKGHNQREYEDKWPEWQKWTDEKLATKVTKDDQQLVLLLQPGGGLTICQSLKVEDGGKGHTCKGGVGIVNVA